MDIVLYIVAYLVLTAIAIYFAKNDGILDGIFYGNSTPVIFVRIMFVLLIGWLLVIFSQIAEQTVGYKTNENDFYIIDWVGRTIKKSAKKIMPKRKKKEEVEACSYGPDQE